MSFVLVSCQDKFIISGKTMGTTYSITSNQKIDKKSIDAELQRINTIFSNWIPTSEVERFNHLPVHTTFKASKEFMFVIRAAQKIHQQTHGFFDITLGKLIDIWGFGVQKVTTQPTPSQVQQALQHSGMQYLDSNNTTLSKSQNIHLNLSAIAKGYAVDKIAELLTTKGISDFVVEIGGEVRVLGAKTIGIERLGEEPFAVKLHNEAIATSGDYRNYRIWNDEKFIHILDPHTGYPSKSDLVSVSVIAKDCATADGWATALLAMGKAKAVELIRKYQLKSVLIDNNNTLDTFNL